MGLVFRQTGVSAEDVFRAHSCYSIVFSAEPLGGKTFLVSCIGVLNISLKVGKPSNKISLITF